MGKTALAATLIMLALSILATAQTATKPAEPIPDLSGKWEWVGESPKDVKARYLIVTQDAEKIIFEEVIESYIDPWRYQIVLFPDKRGEKNHLPIRNSNDVINVDSRTSWKKNKLVRMMTYTTGIEFSSTRGSVTNRDTETYGLSKDGSLLVIEIAAAQDFPLSITPIRRFVKKTYRRVN